MLLSGDYADYNSVYQWLGTVGTSGGLEPGNLRILSRCVYRFRHARKVSNRMNRRRSPAELTQT